MIIFLGGIREYPAYYDKYVELTEQGHIVICPNLTYKGLFVIGEPNGKIPDYSLIVDDCLRNLEICDKVIFIIKNTANLRNVGTVLNKEYIRTLELNIKYETIYL